MKDQSAADPGLPRHVAVIMDGNGRWARRRLLPRIEGHRRGSESVRACTEACIEAGVPWLTLYAFSTENWNRPSDEVSALMDLLDRFLAERTEEILRNNIRLLTIGRIGDLPARCRDRLLDTVERSKGNTALNLTLALSYGSRIEITEAVQSIARAVREGRLEPDSISEETISSRLYTAGTPDPDLLIRTSGEMRLSNFLLWQLSYTEIVVSPKFWPDFGKEDFHAALAEYRKRHRRYGGV